VRAREKKECNGGSEGWGERWRTKNHLDQKDLILYVILFDYSTF
jgi:hypothetical protein